MYPWNTGFSPHPDPERSRGAMTQDYFDKKENFQQIPLFRGLSERGIARLLDTMNVIDLPGYAVIYLQDDFTDGAHIVRKGLVKTTKLLPSGKEYTLELFFRGEAFGLRGLFGPDRRSSNAFTIEPSSLFVLPERVIAPLGPDLARLRVNVFDLMEDRLRKLEDRVSDLAHRPLRERLANLLITLSRRLSPGDGSKPVLPLSQGELANLVGSTRESVSTLLNQFRKEGILFLKRRCLRIEDLDALLEIAEVRSKR
jgi:CRP/FNR family transcriptional regulator